MTAIPKNVFIDKLDEIVDTYNNTYRAMKMRTIDVNSSTYNAFGVENNDEALKFKIGGFIRI